MEPLTGRDAVEAIGLATHLGNRGARFDGNRLLSALRSRAGRLRIIAGEKLSLRAISRFHGETTFTGRPRSRDRRAVSRSEALSAATAAPDQPRLTPNRQEPTDA